MCVFILTDELNQVIKYYETELKGELDERKKQLETKIMDEVINYSATTNLYEQNTINISILVNIHSLIGNPTMNNNNNNSNIAALCVSMKIRNTIKTINVIIKKEDDIDQKNLRDIRIKLVENHFIPIDYTIGDRKCTLYVFMTNMLVLDEYQVTNINQINSRGGISTNPYHINNYPIAFKSAIYRNGKLYPVVKENYIDQSNSGDIYRIEPIELTYDNVVVMDSNNNDPWTNMFTRIIDREFL